MSEILPTTENAVVCAAELDIELEPVSASEVVSGSPRQGFIRLGALVSSPDEDTTSADSAGAAAELAEVGIWELTAGAVTDTEVSEVFVVISGNATIELLQVPGNPQATGQQISVKAGDVVRLVAGTQTRWTVTDRIRKIYIAG